MNSEASDIVKFYQQTNNTFCFFFFFFWFFGFFPPYEGSVGEEKRGFELKIILMFIFSDSGSSGFGQFLRHRSRGNRRLILQVIHILFVHFKTQ